jgi:hypothetical protein
VLLAADHRRLVAFLGQRAFDLVADLLHQLATVAPRGAPRRLDTPGAHGVQGREAQVLELHAHGIHAQAHGDRRVDVQGLAGDAPRLGRRQHAEGAHVVQAVGELDEDDADIPGHGQGHFLEVLRLFFLQRVELNLRQLRHAVHEIGDSFPELFGDRLLVDPRIFDNVVEHRRHETLVVHVHVGEDARHGEGVSDVGFAGAALLPEMRLFGVVVGAPHLRGLLRIQVGAQGGVEGVYRLHGADVASGPLGSRGVRDRLRSCRSRT